MKILFRKKALVIIERDNGEWWITKRKKYKHDCRRQKPIERAVKYFPIKQIMTHKLIEDYLSSYMDNKNISVSEYIEDENNKNIIIVRYSYKFKNGDFGSYNEIENVNLIELMGFLYSKIK